MKGRLVRMQKHLHHLKILADINDPTIRMRFEDGKGVYIKPKNKRKARSQRNS